MPSILVCYGTGEGQTRKVARRIAGVIEERGHGVTVVDADEVPEDLDVSDFDAVVVGTSVHAGRHQESVRRFVTANRVRLLEVPSGFFQVSMSSAIPDPGDQSRAREVADGFFETTGWHPDRLGLFGGALLYSQYGFVKRLAMRWWAGRTTGDVDTSRDYEYTDWREVDRFAGDFARFVEGEVDETVAAEAREREIVVD